MTRSRTNNGASKVSLDKPLRDFDLLPPPIRRAFAHAPYDFAFGDILAQVRLAQRNLGRSLNADEIAFALEAMKHEAALQVAVSAYALYGEHHPQARRVSGATLHQYGLLATRNEMELWRQGKRNRRGLA